MSKNLKVNIETITPAKAQELVSATLKADANYRRSSRDRVAMYARDMTARRWKLNGESIKLHNGLCYDGMHRLLACIEANKPFDTVVVRGVTDADMLSIDRIRPRTLDQEMVHMGVKNANVVAAATRMYFYLVYRAGGQWAGKVQQRASDGELVAFYRKHKRAIDSAAHMQAMSHEGLRASQFMSGSVLAVILLAGTHDEFETPEASEDAAKFCVALATGESLKHCPAVALRNKYLKEKAKGKGAHRLSTESLRALSVYAWNLFVNGEKAPARFQYSLTSRKFPVVEQATA